MAGELEPITKIGSPLELYASALVLDVFTSTKPSLGNPYWFFHLLGWKAAEAKLPGNVGKLRITHPTLYPEVVHAILYEVGIGLLVEAWGADTIRTLFADPYFKERVVNAMCDGHVSHLV
jgi:hypothetical protein